MKTAVVDEGIPQVYQQMFADLLGMGGYVGKPLNLLNFCGRQSSWLFCRAYLASSRKARNTVSRCKGAFMAFQLLDGL